MRWSSPRAVARGGCRWARAHLAAARLSRWAARPAGKGKEGGKDRGSEDEEPPPPLPFHRSRLSDSRESSPGAPGPASAHVIPGPPLPPPLAREAASSALRAEPGRRHLARALRGSWEWAWGRGKQTLPEPPLG